MATGGVAGAAGGSASWRDSLPEDIRGNPSIVTFKDIEAVTRSFIHAQSVIGKKGAIAPSDWSKATAEERASFYQAVGGPAADKYEVKAPAEAKIAPEFINGFKQQAIQSGVLPHQANELVGWFAKVEADNQKKAQENARSADVKNLEALKTEWGGEDAYKRNLQAIAFFAKQEGGDEAVKVLMNDARVGNNVPLLKLLNAAAKKLLSEDTLREGGIGTGAPSRTEIEAELASIRANGATNGYWDGKHPNHAIMVKKVESLGKMLTAGR